MKRAVLVFLAVFALVAVGCSSKKSSNKSGDTTTTKAQTQSLSSDERDQIAGDALLTTEDLPGSGWETAPSDESDSSSDDDLFGMFGIFAECQMFADRDKPPTKQDGYFGVPTSNKLEQAVDEDVGVWETSDEASAAIALFTDNEAALRDCLQAALGAAALVGTLGLDDDIQVDVDAFDVNQGDDSVGFEASIEVPDVKASAVFAVVRTGPAAATMFMFGVDKSDSDEVIATATDKLEQAVAG